jgi:hypothetical protein
LVVTLEATSSFIRILPLLQCGVVEKAAGAESLLETSNLFESGIHPEFVGSQHLCPRLRNFLAVIKCSLSSPG